MPCGRFGGGHVPLLPPPPLGPALFVKHYESTIFPPPFQGFPLKLF